MSRDPDSIMNDSFLETRAKLLEIAATLDRIDRAALSGQALSPEQSVLRNKIDEAIKICASDRPDRAAEMQLLFSRAFNGDWRSEMGL